MDSFMYQFFRCNIFISIIIGMIFAAKRLLKHSLSSRMQYRLWFLLLGLLAVPFLPGLPLKPLPLFSWFPAFCQPAGPLLGTMFSGVPGMPQPAGAGWMEDFAITAGRETPSALWLSLFFLWIAGVAAMGLCSLKSILQFHRFHKSALPLQNPAIKTLYQGCLEELGIARAIPIYSTAYLTSPVIAGLIYPRIYLPIRLLSGCPAKDMRYMLLHELQHYRHKDALANFFLSLAGALYWFHPLVRLALREMKHDREIACDTAVLNVLEEEDYKDYGHTLINFAEKTCRSPIPFSAGISGTMAQMEKRILNIAAYRPASRRQNLRSALAFGLVAALLSGFVPFLSIQAAGTERSGLPSGNVASFGPAGVSGTALGTEEGFGANAALPSHGVPSTDFHFKEAFGTGNGSFVLYDTAKDTWQIYNEAQAVRRSSPLSTYKIYSALLALESGVITPSQSYLPWDGQERQYPAWNAGQTLDTAMEHSATWYFQALDQKAGHGAIRDFIQKIGYGNQNIGKNTATYWGDSTLKISPVEQVELLRKFYYNEFGFSPENIDAVKKSICLSVTDYGTIYGKTGTAEENGKNIAGWFIGYLETEGNVYFFAADIQNETQASGSVAAELTFSALASMGLWGAD